MTSEQVIGYVFSGLSLVALWVVRLCNQSSNKCVSIDGNVNTNLYWALKEFGGAIPTTSISAPNFTQAVDHLLRLYQSKVRIGQLSRVTRAIMFLALIGFTLVVVLVCVGTLLWTGTGDYGIPVGYVAPLLLFLYQVILLTIALVKVREINEIKVWLDQEQDRYSTSWDSE